MKGAAVLEALQRRLLDVEQLNSKLILIVGGTGEGRSALLEALHAGHLAAPLYLGATLANALAQLPQRERHLQAGTLLREVAQSHASAGALLVDGIEVLFDASLKVNALDLLKRQALSRPVIAAWPGVWRSGRLIYAALGHPEYQDYAPDGVTIFEI
jgi:hypothetical protein